MKSTLNVLALMAATIATIPSVAAEPNRPALPNIILMMTDDMGIGDTSAYLGVCMGPKAEPIALTQRTPRPFHAHEKSFHI